MGVNGCVIGFKALTLVLDQLSPDLGEGALACKLAALAQLSLGHGRF